MDQVVDAVVVKHFVVPVRPFFRLHREEEGDIVDAIGVKHFVVPVRTFIGLHTGPRREEEGDINLRYYTRLHTQPYTANNPLLAP